MATSTSERGKISDAPAQRSLHAYDPLCRSSKDTAGFIIGHKYEAIVTVALTLGLRRGETLGLRWRDINFETSRLTVRHSLETVKGKGARLTDTKSEKSKRELRIPQICLIALEKHQNDQAKQIQWAGTKWKNGDFVFTTSLGTPMHPDEISHVFPQILNDAKLPKVRFHDLRHTCASLLLSLGVPAKLVQETLGHSTYQLTMDTYSHMIPALRNEVADRMDEILSTTVNEAVKPATARIN